MTFGSRAVRPGTEAAPGVWTIVAVFIAAVLCLALCMDRNLNVYDEGFMLLDATRVLDGELPHRDFYTNYGPGQIYVLAALYKLFGVSVLVERAWDTVVRAGIVVLVLVLVNQVASRWIALAAAAASLIALASFGFYAYPVFPALAAALASAAFLVPAFTVPQSAARLVAAGVCVGIGMLVRYDVGIALFGSEGAILAFNAWSKRSSAMDGVRAAIRLVCWFGVGFAVVVVPVAIAFAVNRVIPDLVFQVVVFQSKFYARMRHLPFPLPWRFAGDLREFAVYLPLLPCIAAVMGIVAIARARRGTAEETMRPSMLPWMMLTMVVLTLVFFAKGAIRVGVIHMSMALITSLVLTAMLTRSVRGRGWIGRGMLILTLLAAFAFEVSCLSIDADRARRNIAWAMDAGAWEVPVSGLVPSSGSCRMPPGMERLACFRVSTAAQETMRFVRERTEPGDRVFVGVTRHDIIFVNDALLYFELNRPSATRWHQFDPGLQNSAPIQQEIVGELRAAKARAIVLVSTWDDVHEPNDSALSSGVTVLDDYIKSAFTPVATFGPNTVLMPRSPGTP